MMGGRVPPEYGSKKMEATAVPLKGPGPAESAATTMPTSSPSSPAAMAEGAIDGGSLVDLTPRHGRRAGLGGPAGHWWS